MGSSVGRASAYLHGPGGTLLSVASGRAVHDYATDRRGSVTGLVTTGGALAATYQYDPYGDLIGGTGTAYNPYRYTGAYIDAATGLVKIGRRYYDPGVGRWTQPDPKGMPFDPVQATATPTRGATQSTTSTLWVVPSLCAAPGSSGRVLRPASGCTSPLSRVEHRAPPGLRWTPRCLLADR